MNHTFGRIIRLMGLLAIGASIAMALVACRGEVTDVPASTDPSPAVAPTVASPVAPPTATSPPRIPPTPTFQIEPQYGIEHLPVVVLGLRDVEAEFGRNYRIHKDEYIDNASVDVNVLWSAALPNFNIDSTGRINGYLQYFEYAEADDPPPPSHALDIAVISHLFAMDVQASDFLYLLVRDFEGLKGRGGPLENIEEF